MKRDKGDWAFYIIYATIAILWLGWISLLSWGLISLVNWIITK